MEVLAKRLKWLREKERYSQKEIAAKIGMTVSGYQKIEYGERDPKLDVLIKLAELYGESTDFLLGVNDKNKVLNEISEKINVYKALLGRAKMELKINSFNLKNAQEEYDRLKEISDRDENYFKYREMYITYLTEKKKRVEMEMFSNQTNYEKCVLDYINILVDIPEAKPWKDDIIKSITPIDIDIQMYDSSQYSLVLYGKNDFYGTYHEFESLEAAQRKKDKLIKLLNGI
jgi:transcriptional regulator with XRE-family HTH domain